MTLDRNWLKRFRCNLRRWYEAHARDLPWRRSSDAYHVWLSEIMLQQTTVTAVVPYFERFIARFPTVDDLAAASEEDVLLFWEGLGYYSRARNIHKTAQTLVARYNSRLPEEVDKLEQLPGIGRYTAGAIASIAFEARAPIVEANTLRLYSRLLGYRGDPRSREGQTLLWDFAGRILPRKRSGQFNQALMELGSRVCTPSEPDCPHCPVRSCCTALAENAQHSIPLPKSRPKVTYTTEASIAVRKNGAYLLRRCGSDERWSGMWDFPRFRLDELAPPTTQKHAANNGHRLKAMAKKTRCRLEESVLAATGVETSVNALVTEIEHSVTRYRIRLLCYGAVHTAGSLQPNRELSWVSPDEFRNLPLSVTGRKFADLLVGSSSELFE